MYDLMGIIMMIMVNNTTWYTWEVQENMTLNVLITEKKG